MKKRRYEYTHSQLKTLMPHKYKLMTKKQIITIFVALFSVAIIYVSAENLWAGYSNLYAFISIFVSSFVLIRSVRMFVFNAKRYFEAVKKHNEKRKIAVEQDLQRLLKECEEENMN